MMDEATINRLIQSAFDEADARAEQKLEERLKEAEDRLTKKLDDEVLEILQRYYQAPPGP